MKPWTNKSSSLGIVGLLLVGLGASLCFLWPTLFHQILQKGLALTPTSRSYEMWKDTSQLPPMFLRIYFFNWTNPEELRIRGKKPHLVQVGPYSFREIRQKTNITFHHENKTVSYFQRRFWYFDAEQSNGSLTDRITHLNVVATSAVRHVRYWSYAMQKSLSFLLTTTNSQIHVVKTVDELLFKGYHDNLLTLGKDMVESDMPKFDHFGWFYTRNGSSDLDGCYNMETGEDDISQLGIMRKWKHKDTTKFYKSPCNIVEGSAGEFWPPGRTKDEITLFSVDLCRPIIYEYERTVSHFGIEGYRYSMDQKTLGNATRRRYPHDQAKFFEPTTTTEDFFMSAHSSGIEIATTTENTPSNDEFADDDPDIVNMGNCYCNGECTPSGLLNLTSCRYGAPAFASLPHFYKADPNLLDQVEGLSPNAKDHNFFITLEPTTGIPLQVEAKLQINILLQSSQSVTLFNDIPKIYLPIFWFSLKVEVTEDMAYSLRQLLSLPTIMLCTGITTAAIGFGLITVIAIIYLKQKYISPQSTEVTTEKQVDEISDRTTEMVYMDKVSSNEDTNIKGDRRLYAKLQ